MFSGVNCQSGISSTILRLYAVPVVNTLQSKASCPEFKPCRGVAVAKRSLHFVQLRIRASYVDRHNLTMRMSMRQFTHISHRAASRSLPDGLGIPSS